MFKDTHHGVVCDSIDVEISQADSWEMVRDSLKSRVHGQSRSAKSQILTWLLNKCGNHPGVQRRAEMELDITRDRYPF